MAGTARILSIDGGGIRGVIPARILEWLEAKLGRRTSDVFHLVSGTSTGGIIAASLTKPAGHGQGKHRSALRAKDLLDLYVNHGSEVFNRSFWHGITSVGGLLEEKYSDEGLEKLLRRYLGGAQLANCTADTLVTSYDIVHRKPFFFKSWRAKKQPLRNFRLRDVARATSAAPTYFEPALIRPVGRSKAHALVDGGVFANNPVMCAYASARVIYPRATDILLVSIGTGEHTRRIEYKDAEDWGLVEWARPLLSVIFDGVADTVDYQLQQVLAPQADGESRYYRFQIRLKEGNDDIDDVTRANIATLVRKAEEILDNQAKEFETLATALAAPKTPVSKLR